MKGAMFLRFILHDNQLVPNGSQEAQAISRLPEWHTPAVNPTFSFNASLQQFLVGKQLLPDELASFSFSTLHEHYEQGYIHYQKSIVKKDVMTCMRCGNQQQHLFASFHCGRCYSTCTYCRACIGMGRVSECTPLIAWKGPPLREVSSPTLTWKGKLSPAQQTASSQMVEAVHSKQELLVWAVCGAGKTEVLFEGISKALALGKSVCVATPRTDVVLELHPRLQQAFQELEVVALYGGSADKGKHSSLILTTTHQLLRYYEAFDVMIIDEVDAFPYSAEPMLQYAAHKARKAESTLIYLTATPSESLKQQVKENKLAAVKIPARYHRYPIPIPRFVWCGNWQKRLVKKKLPFTVLNWIKQRVCDDKQCFVFVPKVKWVQPVVELIQQLTPRVAGVHAEDKERKEKVKAFREQQYTILVTTTILERGVTVPNIDVAVVGAENEIFTESALVQISGRVGRSANFPTGDVVFFHYGQTVEMKKAKKHMVDMNDMAKKQGLIQI